MQQRNSISLARLGKEVWVERKGPNERTQLVWWSDTNTMLSFMCHQTNSYRMERSEGTPGIY